MKNNDALDACRQEFEKWFLNTFDKKPEKENASDDHYSDKSTRAAWNGWQAAYNTRPQPCADAVKALEELDAVFLTILKPAPIKYVVPHELKYEALDKLCKHWTTIRAALTQPKADVDLMASVYEEERAKYIGGTVYYPNNQAAFVGCMNKAFAAKGYIGVPDGWRDISTIPDNLMSGVDLWDDREEKRYINCTFDLRLQAWADENYDFVKIPTHWMPLPATPKKEG